MARKPGTWIDREGLSITYTEHAILRLAANGHTDVTAARFAHISPLTVTTLLKRLRRRWGARNTPHAVAMAVRAGILTAEDIDTAAWGRDGGRAYKTPRSARR